MTYKDQYPDENVASLIKVYFDFCLEEAGNPTIFIACIFL